MSASIYKMTRQRKRAPGGRVARIPRNPVPRQHVVPSTVIDRTEFLIDVPGATAGQPITSARIRLNNNLTPYLTDITQHFSEYRFTHLHFTYQSTQSAFVPGNIYLAFDSRFNQTPPNSVDGIINLPHYFMQTLSSTNQTFSPRTTRGLTLGRSIATQPWYRCGLEGASPNSDDTLGSLYVGSDSTEVGTVPGHLFVHYRLVLRN